MNTAQKKKLLFGASSAFIVLMAIIAIASITLDPAVDETEYVDIPTERELELRAELKSLQEREAELEGLVTDQIKLRQRRDQQAELAYQQMLAEREAEQAQVALRDSFVVEQEQCKLGVRSAEDTFDDAEDDLRDLERDERDQIQRLENAQKALDDTIALGLDANALDRARDRLEDEEKDMDDIQNDLDDALKAVRDARADVFKTKDSCDEEAVQEQERLIDDSQFDDAVCEDAVDFLQDLVKDLDEDKDDLNEDLDEAKIDLTTAQTKVNDINAGTINATTFEKELALRKVEEEEDQIDDFEDEIEDLKDRLENITDRLRDVKKKCR